MQPNRIGHAFAKPPVTFSEIRIVEQNTKLCERLDHSMAQLTQAMADLRVQVVQGQADLRQEISQSHNDLHKFFERKFMWLITVYCGVLLTLVGFLGKYFFDSYTK
jgi:hypothetical protein